MSYNMATHIGMHTGVPLPQKVSKILAKTVIFVILVISISGLGLALGVLAAQENHASISTSALIFSKEGIQLESKFSGTYPQVRI